MTSERVVIDTGILIGGLLSVEMSQAAVIERATARAQIVATTATLRELIVTFLSPRLDPYATREERDALLLRFAPFVDVVGVLQRVSDSHHPKWGRLLEAAVNGRADIIVAAHRDFIARSPFRGITILGPDEYVKWQGVRSLQGRVVLAN